MASKKITLYAEKKYEFSEIAEQLERVLKEGGADKFLSSQDEYGETKILHCIAERWYLRTTSYAGLSILLLEYKGYQKAEVIALGGKDDFFSLGAEGHFANCGAEALEALGFLRSRKTT